MLTHTQSPLALPQRVVILGASGFLASALQRSLELGEVPVLALPRTRLDLTASDAATVQPSFCAVTTRCYLTQR